MTRLDSKTQTWMREAAVTRLFKALPEGTLRFVGGCVRNALLGEAVGDIDLATQLPPDEVIKCLDVAKIRYVPTGIDHGTLTVVIDKKPYEITSLRKDIETDGRLNIFSQGCDFIGFFIYNHC